jgi:RecA-family ATPase
MAADGKASELVERHLQTSKKDGLMSESIFDAFAPKLKAKGYYPLSIAPGTKTPGHYVPSLSQYEKTSGWTHPRRPIETMPQPGAGVGVRLGLQPDGTYIVALDWDSDDAACAAIDVFPPAPSKAGKRGFTNFYRCSQPIESRDFKINDCAVVQVLATGRQTVAPPSIHPDTRQPYTWTSSTTLYDINPSELPELPADYVEKIQSILRPLEKPEHTNGHDPEPDNDNPFWQLNALALKNLPKWVPDLNLYKCRRQSGRYDSYIAVAAWRESSEGRPLEQRDCNLKITSKGIKDHGNGDTFSAIDLVMTALNYERSDAVEWLQERLQPDDGIEIDYEALTGKAKEQNDKQDESESPKKEKEPPKRIGPRPLRRLDEKVHPRREWVLAQHYMLGTITATVAPGGLGKSSLDLIEALSMALGRDLLHGEELRYRSRVWYHNAEEKLEELERRVLAACKHYGITYEDLEGWFFLTGREQEIKVGAGQGQLKIDKSVVKQLTDSISDDEIEVAIFDPLIALHGTTEKSNENMRGICEVFAKIADVTGCAIEITHHTRKMQPGQEELTASDSRGAGAIMDAVRSMRVLNRMTDSEASKLGLDSMERRRFMRLDRDKANMVPADAAVWLKFESVLLDNGDEAEGIPGDNVGVVVRWEPSEPIALMTADDRAYFHTMVTNDPSYREDQRAANWIGRLIAERLRFDLRKKYDQACAKAALEDLLARGVFKIARRKDAKGIVRSYIAPGEVPTSG